MAITQALESAGGGMADNLWIAVHLVEDNMNRKRGRRSFAGSTIHVEISDIAWIRYNHFGTIYEVRDGYFGGLA